MSINPYFNTSKHQASQNLIEDLTIEAIKMHGLEVYYIPREIVKEDSVFGEDVLSKFTEAFMIEAYLESVDQWGGEGEVLAKFGLQSKDSMDLVISKKRFSQEIHSTLNLKRPKEGDLIYVPLSNTMFEITFVEHENPFYQLGKLHTYKLSCELFRYSYETIDTGNTAIDKVQTPIDSDTGQPIQQYAIDLTIAEVSDNGNSLDYKLGETVYVGVDLASATATANVIAWITGTITSTLRVNNLTGTLAADSYLTGDVSGAIRQYQTQVTTTIHIEPAISDDIADNDDLQDLANEFLDFSEYNPFSEGDF